MGSCKNHEVAARRMQTDVGDVSLFVNKQTARHPNWASLVENIKVMTSIKWKKTDYTAAVLGIFRIFGYVVLVLRGSPGELNWSDRFRFQWAFFYFTITIWKGTTQSPFGFVFFLIISSVFMSAPYFPFFFYFSLFSSFPLLFYLFHLLFPFSALTPLELYIFTP